MKLLAGSRSTLEKTVDQSYAESSIVCRYRNAVQFYDHTDDDEKFKRFLLENSIREGARIFPLLTYKQVAIHILDETSRMETGTLKAIDGCLTASLSRMEGASQIAFESGGNTGAALTRYGLQTGVQTFFFCPLENLDLLDSRLFTSKTSHLIGIEKRGQVKELSTLFAKTAGIRRVPDREWRYAAAMFRGLFILEQMLRLGTFDWISQAVSAAFGPIGIYHILRNFRSEVPNLPRFLGIQQENNCPMYEAWKTGLSSSIPVKSVGREKEELLTKVMYDDSPQTYNSYPDLRQLLMSTAGDMLTVNSGEFETYLTSSKEYPPLMELLLSRGVHITLRSGKVLEKTGIMALVGTLKAIDLGTIPTGTKVLCCLTSGVSDADGRAQPEAVLSGTRDVLAYAASAAGWR